MTTIHAYIRTQLTDDIQDHDDLTLFQSKVGGCPDWLDRSQLPDPHMQLSCAQCGHQYRFLLQIYACRDEPQSAFHRMLYMFGCTACKNQFTVLRSQLPRINPFYPESWEASRTEIGSSILPNCCQQCALPISSKLNHQCGTYPELALKVEDIDQTLSDGSFSPTAPCEDIDDEEADEDAAFEEVSQQNRQTYFEYMEKYPHHVLRYCPGDRPIWDASNKATIPSCEICQCPREFEFQVQSSLISMLENCDFDFTTICVYTCSKSCSPSPLAGSAYLTEFVLTFTENMYDGAN